MGPSSDRQPEPRKPKRGNGEGSITHRKNGGYAAVVSVPGPGGTRTRKFYYARTRAEANAKLTKALRDLHLGMAPVNERTTVGQFLRQWFAETIESNRRPGTVAGYRNNIERHIIPAIGNVTLARLQPSHIRKLQSELAAKQPQPLAPASIRYVRAVLRSALKQAQADGAVHRNVVELTEGPPVRRPEIRPLTPDQVRAFLAGVEGDRFHALYVLAFTLGLRQSELLGLRWQSVDLEEGTLRVTETLERGPDIALGAPKSERSRRTLVLPAITLSALRDHKKGQDAEREKAGERWVDFGFVFTTHVGTPLDHRNCSRYFHRHLKRLELPHQRFHDARHACATFLLSQGVQLRVVQEILGHSQISLTADTYAHVTAALQRDAIGHIDRAFGAGNPVPAEAEPESAAPAPVAVLLRFS